MEVDREGSASGPGRSSCALRVLASLVGVVWLLAFFLWAAFRPPVSKSTLLAGALTLAVLWSAVALPVVLLTWAWSPRREGARRVLGRRVLLVVLGVTFVVALSMLALLRPNELPGMGRTIDEVVAARPGLVLVQESTRDYSPFSIDNISNDWVVCRTYDVGSVDPSDVADELRASAAARGLPLATTSRVGVQIRPRGDPAWVGSAKGPPAVQVCFVKSP